MTKRPMKYSGGRYCVKYGRRKLDFELTYTDRKHLTINVHPSMTVAVKAPLGKAPGEVVKRVQRRAAWILKQLQHFEQFHPLPTERKYVSGETHLYLGRQYMLKVIKSKKSEVKLIGRFLRVHTPFKGNNGYNGSLVKEWYDNHATRVLDHRLSICMESAIRARLRMPKIRYRHMKRRWGSCSKSGIVTLNIELVKAPTHCIDYVIMHELCHIKYRNHSPQFWRMLSRLMPDWERTKKRLERVVI